ncbi:MAG: NifU family protein [Planctomycetes bacterium]|nr:NifU family protein [Planctomycetota bacterium]
MSIPADASTGGDDKRSQVEMAIKEIRPHLQRDGGDIQLVDVDEETGVVTVRLQGACAGCPGAQMTLKAGVERILRERVPGIQRVEAAT